MQKKRTSAGKVNSSPKKKKVSFLHRKLDDIRYVLKLPVVFVSSLKPITREKGDADVLTVEDNGTVAKVKERLQSLGSENLKIIYSFMKVIALTTATIILLRMMVDIPRPLRWNAQPDWYRIFAFIAWGTSFIILLITYDAPMFGTLFVFDAPPMWLTVFPSLFTILEFMAFAVLSPSFFMPEPDANLHWENSARLMRWFLANGLYHWGVTAFCWYAMNFHSKQITALGDKSLAPVMMHYRHHLRRERSWTFLVGAISMLCVTVHVLDKSYEIGSPFFWTATPALLITACLSVVGYMEQYSQKRDQVITMIREDRGQQ